MDIKRTTDGYALNWLEVHGLAPRESQVLLLKASGLTSAAAAKELGCSTRTVRGRMENLFYKLGARNGTEMITNAVLQGKLKINCRRKKIEHFSAKRRITDRRGGLC